MWHTSKAPQKYLSFSIDFPPFCTDLLLVSCILQLSFLQSPLIWFWHCIAKVFIKFSSSPILVSTIFMEIFHIGQRNSQSQGCGYLLEWRPCKICQEPARWMSTDSHIITNKHLHILKSLTARIVWISILLVNVHRRIDFWRCVCYVISWCLLPCRDSIDLPFKIFSK